MRQRALMLLLLLAPLSSPADEHPEAVRVAEAWLALTDAGRWSESWRAGAELFRANISEADFARSLEGIRVPMGEVQQRELTRARQHTVLPGAPDGDYVVMKFSTAFGRRTRALETVTVMRDPDGRYRVAGYYIR